MLSGRTILRHRHPVQLVDNRRKKSFGANTANRHNGKSDGLLQQETPKPHSGKPVKNPIILAMEYQQIMQDHGLSKTRLADGLGISKARVTQVLNLLTLDQSIIEEIESFGDPQTMVTERQLRKLVPSKTQEVQFNALLQHMKN